MGEYKQTPQRQAILDYLQNTVAHPTAEMVYDQVKNIIPHISLGTIYRNLNFMKDRGEVIEIPGEIGRYDAKTSPHTHFVCENCQKIIDVLDKKNSGPSYECSGIGEVDHAEIYLYGTCKKCLVETKPVNIKNNN